jgi:putative copper resistance protein D
VGEELLLGWRFDVVVGPAALVLAALYLLGVRRARDWPRGRTAAWLLGCVVVLAATSSGVGVLSHVLLAVLAPVLLVLGGPLTLALRARPPTRPRAWLLALPRSPACRVVTHPATAFVLLIGPFAVLHIGEAALGGSVNAVFLVGGYAFFWPVIGVDPGVRRLPHAARVGLMAAVLAGFGFVAVVLGNRSAAAGNVVWALGELPVLVLVMVTVARWARSDEREAAHAEPDLTAYNAMLADLDKQNRR